MKYNCVVSLKTIAGVSTDKKQGTAVTGIRAYITPSTNDVMVLYPELPVGQTFSFLTMSSEVVISPETEMKITDAFSSELAVNDTFIVSGIAKKNKIGGQFLLSGVCVRKDL